MTAFYSLVQVVPDPLADERVNVGVVTVGSGASRNEFLSDVGRASRFLSSYYEAGALHKLVEELRDDLESELAHAPDPVELLRGLSKSWDRDVRLTEPRVSALDVDALVQFVAERALMNEDRRPRARDGRSAASIGRREVQRAIQERQADLSVKSSVEVDGLRQSHHLEFGILNGQLRMAVTGLSFEGAWSLARTRSVDALKWLVDDLREVDTAPSVAVVVIPPDPGSLNTERHDSAIGILAELGAEVVTEHAVSGWADRAIGELSPSPASA